MPTGRIIYRKVTEGMSTNDTAINAPNLCRLETPGGSGWIQTARAGGPKTFFMVSTDSHANEPADLGAKRLPTQYRARAPRIVTGGKGMQWRYCEDDRPDRVRVTSFDGEDWRRAEAGADPAPRVIDNRGDGIDVEIILPNKGLAMWATPDPAFSLEMCKVWHDWAWDVFGP